MEGSGNIVSRADQEGPRTVTPAQNSSSQTEKEALALIFAVQKFHRFLHMDVTSRRRRITNHCYASSEAKKEYPLIVPLIFNSGRRCYSTKISSSNMSTQ
uniref:Uncharacterized protein n=1 Tax=Parascaris equorum TaxID=6256 RepID=A0A914SB12_PAREQ